MKADGMSGYHQKGRRAGRVATCALALALVCAAPTGKAYAEYFPEGKGEFDISVVTNVLPSVDPDAELCDVAVHVANDAGEHLGDAQVEVAVVPPNAEGYDPAEQPQTLAGREATHALSASGSTSSDGRVLLPNADVGATYQVEAVKDGHESFEGRFTCSGIDGEVWEVTLRRMPEPLPPGSSNGGAPVVASDRAASGHGAPEAMTSRFESSGEGSEAATDAFGAAGVSDATDRAARPVRGFVGFAADAFPYWLVVVGIVATAMAVGLLLRARRVGRDGAAHEKRA